MLTYQKFDSLKPLCLNIITLIMVTSFWITFVVIAGTLAQAAFFTDQKEDCSKNVRNNFCYNGPMFDAIGQYKSCATPGVVAITFDDGPSAYTSHILDMLQLFDMKATFFVIGSRIRTYHDVIQRMVDEGHQVGSHTHSHMYLDEVPDPVQEMLKFEVDFVREDFNGPLANGFIPSYMRAPHGALTELTFDVVKNQLGYLPIHWGFLTQDSNGIPASEIVPRYQARLGGVNGEGVNAPMLSVITQQHDSQLATAASFEDLLFYLNSTFGSQGVKFVTMSECLGNTVPPYRPNPRLQNDPLCLKGIKKSGYCCMLSCGSCGGTGCSTRVGGAEGCCSTNILTANYSCTRSPAPCLYV